MIKGESTEQKAAATRQSIQEEEITREQARDELKEILTNNEYINKDVTNEILTYYDNPKADKLLTYNDINKHIQTIKRDNQGNFYILLNSSANPNVIKLYNDGGIHRGQIDVQDRQLINFNTSALEEVTTTGGVEWKPDGEGEMIYPGGEFCKGNWKDGNPHGLFVVKYPDKDGRFIEKLKYPEYTPYTIHIKQSGEIVYMNKGKKFTDEKEIEKAEKILGKEEVQNIIHQEQKRLRQEEEKRLRREAEQERQQIVRSDDTTNSSLPQEEEAREAQVNQIEEDLKKRIKYHNERIKELNKEITKEKQNIKKHEQDVDNAPNNYEKELWEVTIKRSIDKRENAKEEKEKSFRIIKETQKQLEEAQVRAAIEKQKASQLETKNETEDIQKLQLKLKEEPDPQMKEALQKLISITTEIKEAENSSQKTNLKEPLTQLTILQTIQKALKRLIRIRTKIKEAENSLQKTGLKERLRQLTTLQTKVEKDIRELEVLKEETNQQQFREQSTMNGNNKRAVIAESRLLSTKGSRIDQQNRRGF